jgi:type I restriction enzyme R subunit
MRSRGRFTEDNLRRAYQHELADIISIVKHAAVGDPLLSAEERVRAGRTFTPEQERWLGLIRNHLVENLAVDREDFRLHPRRRYLGPREPRL